MLRQYLIKGGLASKRCSQDIFRAFSCTPLEHGLPNVTSLKIAVGDRKKLAPRKVLSNGQL
jgi:hypothetical protein